MARPKVLVTGASGLIGGLTLEGLGEKYEFSALNRRPVEGVPCLQADIADADAIRPAFDGINMVLHLSAYTDDGQDWEGTMSTTVGGTLNVFRAAQEAGAWRVVFMSSGSTMCGYEWNDSMPYGKLRAASTTTHLPAGRWSTTGGCHGPIARTLSASFSARRAAAGSPTTTACRSSSYALARFSTPTGPSSSGTTPDTCPSQTPCR